MMVLVVDVMPCVVGVDVMAAAWVCGCAPPWASRQPGGWRPTLVVLGVSLGMERCVRM
jgi:hypothetical protein